MNLRIVSTVLCSKIIPDISPTTNDFVIPTDENVLNRINELSEIPSLTWNPRFGEEVSNNITDDWETMQENEDMLKELANQ